MASLVSLFMLEGVALSYDSDRIVIGSAGKVALAWRGLRVKGKWIVDADENIVILRGANYGGYQQGRSNHIFEDYERMKSWGFNVVRLPIAWQYIEPEPGEYDESYLAMIDQDIQWAKRAGIYIIPDMSQYYWSSHFTFHGGWSHGLPLWMVSGYNNSADGLSQAITDFWLGKAPNGTEPTPQNPSMQDRFIEMWKRIASKYSDETAIAAYDLFNEPLRGELLTASQAADYVYSFYGRLISEIRELDENHIAIYEIMGGHTARVARVLNYSNVVFSFHFYRLSSLKGVDYSGNITELEDAFLSNYWKLPETNPLESWDIPIWIGEFGSGEGLWARDTVKIFDKYGLGWAWWLYIKSDAVPNALLYSNGTERTHLTKYLKLL